MLPKWSTAFAGMIQISPFSGRIRGSRNYPQKTSRGNGSAMRKFTVVASRFPDERA